MTINALFENLDSAIAFPRSPITNLWADRVFATLNALYEGTFDKDAPDASTQSFIGHNHGTEGGAPIIRNSQATMDAGANFAINLSFAAGGLEQTIDVMPVCWSPKISTSGDQVFAQIAICYLAVDSDFTVSLGDRRRFLLKRSTSGPEPETTRQWGFFATELVSDSETEPHWDLRRLSVIPESSLACELKIHAINIVETFGQTQPRLGTRGAPVNLSGDVEVVIRYFYTLAQELAAIEEWGDSLLFQQIYGSANALFESLLDRPAPGVLPAKQAYAGHDHCSTPADSQEGRAVSRGKIFSAGDYEHAIWVATTVTQNVWEYADLDITPRRTTGSPGGTPTTTSMFRAWVDEEFTSTGNPPTSNPYLNGWILVEADIPTIGGEVRIYNLTTATHSATKAFSAPGASRQWIPITKIPCDESTWNDLAVEVRCTTQDVAEITIKGIIIAESELDNDGAKAAFITSSGASLIGSTRQGITKRVGN